MDFLRSMSPRWCKSNQSRRPPPTSPPPSNNNPADLSVNVPKIQILPIRQIAKRSRIEITSLQPAFHRTLNLISPLVLSRQDEAQSQDQNDFDQVRDDHAPDPELVARGLRGEVEEGAGDVSGAVAEE
jgi:hypothetical protein